MIHNVTWGPKVVESTVEISCFVIVMNVGRGMEG